MKLGYALIFPDNKETMFADIPKEECWKFSNIYSINKIDPLKKINSKKNLSATYDGFVIVTDVFKAFCEQHGYPGLQFVPLPASPGKYWFKLEQVLEFDVNARGTKFVNYDETCQGYEEIVGATPACLVEKKEIGEGFFRSDVCFGGREGKWPVYMIGEKTMQLLKKSGFKELVFKEIHDVYSWQK
jgi:hypothetical protein